jgi:adenosylcobinamide kinase/adenosylcobinamide-phosphate guanylyltransferase
MALVVVGGGARSGKSGFAQRWAAERGSKLAYVATAEGLDAEMRERIAVHRSERGDAFETFEEPLKVAELLVALRGYDVVLIDCLTLWLTNVMLGGGEVEREVQALAAACEWAPNWIVAVTNEVGCGIVPENELARRFRDEAGRMNQVWVGRAAEAYWMVFGVPLRLK